MNFIVIPRSQRFPESGSNEIYLRIDHWDDYSFVTMFDLRVFDGDGVGTDLGSVKIGFAGQARGVPTYSTIGDKFEILPDTYFSLGQDVDYYSKIYKSFNADLRQSLLTGLRDVVFDEFSYNAASGEDVFRVSLLRSVSTSTITGQYRRVLGGGAPLSNFDFGFMRSQSDSIAGIDIRFFVRANSLPSTNIHTIIGRNGVGNDPPPLKWSALRYGF